MSRIIMIGICGWMLLSCGSPAGRGSCGEVAAGQACNEEEKCACGLTCFQGVCTTVVSPSTSSSATNAPTLSSSEQSLLTQACKVSENLVPCMDSDGADVVEDCKVQLPQQIAKSKSAGCYAPFQGYLECLIGLDIDCPSDGSKKSPEDLFEMIGAECKPDMDSTNQCMEDSCVLVNGSCTSFGAPGEGDNGNCAIEMRSGCDDIVTAECESSDGIYLCECGKQSANPDKPFVVQGGACCDITNVLESTCGTVKGTGDFSEAGEVSTSTSEAAESTDPLPGE